MENVTIYLVSAGVFDYINLQYDYLYSALNHNVTIYFGAFMDYIVCALGKILYK